MEVVSHSADLTFKHAMGCGTQTPDFQYFCLDQAGLRSPAQPGIVSWSTAPRPDLGIQVQHQEHFPNPHDCSHAHSETPQGYMSGI